MTAQCGHIIRSRVKRSGMVDSCVEEDSGIHGVPCVRRPEKHILKICQGVHGGTGDQTVAVYLFKQLHHGNEMGARGHLVDEVERWPSGLYFKTATRACLESGNVNL